MLKFNFQKLINAVAPNLTHQKNEIIPHDFITHIK